LIVIANFIATLLKLSGFTDYSFYEIHVKSAITLIIYSSTVFTAKDMLNVFVLTQATDVDEVARKSFLGS